jgi:hypothetical protein
MTNQEKRTICLNWIVTAPVMDLLDGGRKVIMIYPKDGRIWLSTGGNKKIMCTAAAKVNYLSVDDLADAFSTLLFDRGVNFSSGRDTQGDGWMFIVVETLNVKTWGGGVT